MAYTPTLWAKGDKVTSEKLNKIEQGIVDKVDKETGKTLSTNDFTDAYKTKLDGIEANADKTTIDATLTNSGDAADAKATGDAIKDIENDLDGKVAIIESDLDEKVENLKSLVGTPLKATTASDMTDTSKIYVYTGNESGYTNGDWYYHDGSAWVDGGTYNSVAVEVDDTLTVNGMPADAKAVGDELSTIKEDLSDVKSGFNDIQTEIGIEIPSLVLTSGSYINASGGISSGGSFSYSAPISVSAGDRVIFTGAGYSTNVAMISACDLTGSNIIPKVISTDADVHDFRYDVTANGYVCVSFNHNKSYGIKIYQSNSLTILNDEIDAINESIDSNLSRAVITSDMFEQGVWRNGAKSASSFSIRIKDGIHVNSYAVITITPNGQYIGLDVWTTRTESEDVITFSNLVTSVNWTNANVTIDIPANSWITYSVRKTYPTNTRTNPLDNLTQIYVCDNQISQNKGDIIALDTRIKTLERTIPDYWETEYARVKDAINSNRLTIGNKIAEFFFITDIHWNGNAKKSPMLINALSKDVGISNVLCGGDVIFTHDTTQLGAVDELRDFYKQFDNGIRLFSTIGNHDFNSNNNADTSTYLTAEQLYPLMMSNEETYTDTKASPYVTVYDNVSQKVRYIQFYHPDVIAIPDATKTAVIDAIEEKDTSWTVVLICHVYWSSGNAVDTYIKSFTEQLAGINVTGEYATISALIVGHMHYDSSVVVDNGLLVIASQCDTYKQSSGSTMTIDTDTEQAFDVFQIDTINKHIYITRVGSGSDRQFDYDVTSNSFGQIST